jgi:hypothetical protein
MKPAKLKVNNINLLRIIPGIGPSLSQDLNDLGIKTVADLKDKNPEILYANLNHLRGQRQDPCVLYVFRCAHYFATHKNHDPEKLKWWNWKDTN